MSKSTPGSTSTWVQRKSQLQTFLGCAGDDEEEGIALDRLLHSQMVTSKTQTLTQIESTRFSDKDMKSFGPLAEAQFGQVELVSCKVDGRVYVRKRVAKKFALRMREQFSPQTERHILLLALKSDTIALPSSKSAECTAAAIWAPRMLCSYQCPTFLNIVMEYATGGSLWDVLESSGVGHLAPTDLSWWAPQCVAAIEWLHTHCGFAHRDIKPHNFVLRLGVGRAPGARLLLIDFGSAAPLLPAGEDGVQRIPRQYCLVPCGTCDYISPEVLQAHEEALVALEMSDDEDDNTSDDSDAGLRWAREGKAQGNRKIMEGDMGYGRETDWWSLGAMLYEMAFGVAPFFANDIRQTYVRIMEHKTSLKFDHKVPMPAALISLIKGLLTHRETRLGRHSVDEIKGHQYFKGVDWSTLHTRPAPPDLLLPQFTYTTPLVSPQVEEDNSETSADVSKPFAFSALFQSSVLSRSTTSPNPSYLQNTVSTPVFGRRSLSRKNLDGMGSAQKSIASFIGFSWGPPMDAFDDATRIVPAEPVTASPGLLAPSGPSFLSGASTHEHPFATPMRPARGAKGAVPPSTVRVTSVRRSVHARPVSDREAMRLLVDCVGMSARKRVLESGKKPKVLLPNFEFAPPPPILAEVAAVAAGDTKAGKDHPHVPSYSRSSPRSSTARKELRFDDTTTQMPSASYTNTFSNTLSNTGSSTNAFGAEGAPYLPYSGSEMSDTECPPSPSPSPRPGSAMSMLSMSRHSATPTVLNVYLPGAVTGLMRSSSEPPEALSRAHARSSSFGNGSGIGSGYKSEKDAAPPAAPRTPAKPRTKKATQHRTPRRAHFADEDEDEEEPMAPKERAPVTPHPRRAAQMRPLAASNAQRRTQVQTQEKNQVQVFTCVGMRRKEDAGANPEASSDEEEVARVRSRSRSEDGDGGEDEAARNGSETETEGRTPDDMDVDMDMDAKIDAERQGRSASPPSADAELALYEDMEQRYARLMADISNVRARIKEFALASASAM